jgi:hypothetical protein
MRIWILGFVPKSKDPDPTFINQGLDPVPCFDLLIRIRRANKPTYPANPDPEHFIMIL